MIDKKINVPIFASLNLNDIFYRFKTFKIFNIYPELYIDANQLLKMSFSDLEELKLLLTQNNMLSTIHAPFWDLSLGSIDPDIKKISINRILTCLNIAKTLNSKNIVIHSGFNKNSFLSSKPSDWQNRFLESLIEILEYAKSYNINISLENVYEETPEILINACENLKKYNLNICFDLGHFNVFSKASLNEWIDTLAPYIFSLHIHSNYGKEDDHLPIDQGNIDFEKIFSTLISKKVKSLVTIENKNDDYLIQSFKILNSEKYFRLINNLMPNLN